MGAGLAERIRVVSARRSGSPERQSQINNSSKCDWKSEEASFLLMQHVIWFLRLTLTCQEPNDTLVRQGRGIKVDPVVVFGGGRARQWRFQVVCHTCSAARCPLVRGVL